MAKAESFKLTIRRNEVHIWCASLDQPENQFRLLQQYLSTDEQARARRYSVLRYRHRFSVGRSLLRTLLGRYLGVGPEQLRFSYGPHGKPALQAGDGLKFNLSHSGGLALYAVTYEREVGVDLERLRMVAELGPLARHYFSAREAETLETLPFEQQSEGFFNCWTRKEAYVKAVGIGLNRTLSSFDVSLRPGETARLLRVEDDPTECERWGIQPVSLQAGYVAAVVAQGQNWELCLRGQI